MNKQIRLIQAFALGMAVLSIPTLATAATTINVVDQAQLLAKGAGVFVSVEITCNPSFGPGSNLSSASVSLFQRAGSGINQGFGFISDTINCDGAPQTFQILVPASGKVFRQGPAIAQASAFVCDPSFSFCESAQVTEEIQLVK
jgi:hypothetical protein